VGQVVGGVQAHCAAGFGSQFHVRISKGRNCPTIP
jgi:hypothetical protein